MTPHPLLKKWQELGISYPIGAEETGIPKSTLYGFLHGEKYFGEKKSPEPIIRAYLESRRPSLKINSKPMLNKLFGMGLSVKEAAPALGLSTGELYRYLVNGKWPNQKLVDAFLKYLADQKEGIKKKMITKISLGAEHLSAFGLKRDPFTNEMEGEDDILDLAEIRKAEKKIMSAVDKNGWVAVTGAVGSGKTTLLKKIERRLVRQKNVIVVRPRVIEKQFLGASHICESILQDLGTHVGVHRTLEHKARLVGRALEETYRAGGKVVIVIDEAHLLRPDALLALKRIYEIEFGFKKLLTLVLVGQPLLARTLKGNFELSEVSQRVDLFEMGSMNGAVGQYVQHKLERAGNGQGLFDSSAFKAIRERADTPLSVNNLAAAALISAWDLGEKVVSGEIVRGIPGSF